MCANPAETPSAPSNPAASAAAESRLSGRRGTRRHSQPDDPDIPALDLVRLRFRDGSVEAAYQAAKRPAHLVQLRLALAFGLALFCLYGPLDARLAGDAVEQAWLLRYGVVTPIVLACLGLSWTPLFRRYPQILLTLVTQFLGASVIGQMIIMPTPGTAYFFSGLITVLIFACCVFRPHPAWATLNCVLLVGYYVAFASFSGDVAPIWFITNINFLIVDSLVAIFATYMFELRLREVYARDRALEVRLARTEQLRQQAEQANMMKSRFVATASHELRTPLNAIVGFAEILANERFGPLGNASYREYAATIHDSGQRLRSTVEDLLDVSKAQSNTLEIACEDLDLGEILRQAVREVQPQAAEKGLTVSIAHCDPGLGVHADPRLLRRAAANLLSNAVKFTDEGSVTVAGRRCGDDWVCVEVIDTGPGIDEAEQGRIFDSFVHGGSAYSRRTSGAGLGLALVQQIAQMHGGEVTLASTPGEGTRFTLMLPAPVVATTAAA